MATYAIKNPSGMMPAITPLSRAANIASSCANVKLTKGDVRAFKNRLFINTPAKTGTKKSIFRWGSNIWFHWLSVVDVVKGPVAGDNKERVYYTGDGPPKMTYSPIAVDAGEVGFPKNWRTWGVPAPATAPTVALGAGGGCATGLQEARNYVVTLTTDLGEESPPSPVSATLMVCPGQTINFTSIPTYPPGGGTHTIMKREIYQSVTGSNGSVKFRLVHTINDGTTTTAAVTVTTAPVTLLPSTLWDPPPSDMHSVVTMPNGIILGLSKNDVCSSEAFIPHAWPTEYRQAMDFKGVGLGAFGSTAVVATEGHPYIISGSTPKSLKMEKVAINQACVSKRGIASGTDGVYYPSPDGLVFIGSGGYDIVTKNFMTREDWQALVPSSIIGAVHDNRFYGWYDTGAVQGGFILDMSAGVFIHTDTVATAAFVDLINDGLYLQVGSNIEQWDAATGSITWTWIGTDSLSPKGLNFGWCRLSGENVNNVTLKIYADDALKITKTITNNKPFRLPSGFKARKWRVELTGTGSWTEFTMASSAAELSAI